MLLGLFNKPNRKTILNDKVYHVVLNFFSPVWDDMKTGVIFLAFSFGLSPILMTLTKTISTDTIYAMTFFMLLANLLFHDYGTSAAMYDLPAGSLAFD